MSLNNLLPPSRTPLLLGTTRGGDAGDSADATQETDFSGQPSSLFSNIRVPAALFGGAAAANAYAMPLLPSDGLKVGLRGKFRPKLRTW